MKDYEEELLKLYKQIGLLIREGGLDPLVVISNFIYTLDMMRSAYASIKSGEMP